MNKIDIQTAVKKNLAARRRKDRFFRYFGLSMILFGLSLLALMFISILSQGLWAFVQTEIQITLSIPNDLNTISYARLLKKSVYRQFKVKKRRDKKQAYRLISSGAVYELEKQIKGHPEWRGTEQKIWLLADDKVDQYLKHGTNSLSAKQIAWLDSLKKQNAVRTVWNHHFFHNGDSREPELAGIKGAIMGSLLTLLITIALSLPIGVAAALYLEEFAPKNRWTDFIEININNLAAVPSIIFGLLGLAVFLNFFGVPRSSPLAAGLLLTLMSLPTVIIASRAALRSVPPSIKEAALGIGASKIQAVFHHVLPQALPGMLTGMIIAMAQAMGETAPLLMIGMVAFIVDVPAGITDPATVLPVQVYLWADSPERAFAELTAAAILILLLFLISMNLIAVTLRAKLEKRW